MKKENMFENETGRDRIYLLQKYLRCSPIVP